MSTACAAPTYEPSKENPGGDCGKPATLASPLGDTGRWLPLCPPCVRNRAHVIPIGDVPEQ